jgi:thymidylate kinase
VELAFLLLHANAWRSIDPARRTITDFTPIKDRLFARDMLTVKADLALFDAVYARLHDGGNDPDVVIYLKATPELALDRVRTRYERDSHREFEKGMELDRLRRIEGKYDAHRDQLGRRVLVLDLAEILLSSDSEAESKQRVADAAVELLQCP